MTVFLRALTGAVLMVMLAPATRAEPVPETERIPVDLRRTTLLVRDMERSLALYRDALGLKVRYDNKSVRPPEPGDPPDLKRTTHLMILCANDTFIGCIGLLERRPLVSDAPVVRQKPTYGQVFLVFNVKDLKQRFDTVSKVPGVVVESPPDWSRADVAVPPGTPKVIGSNLWDPDGYFFEMNLLL